MNEEQTQTLIKSICSYFEDNGMTPNYTMYYDEDKEITTGYFEVNDKHFQLVVSIEYETNKAYYFFTNDYGEFKCGKVNYIDSEQHWLKQIRNIVLNQTNINPRLGRSSLEQAE